MILFSIDLLRDGGKLKLRRQDDGDELAEQRTAYTVGGVVRGVDEPCLDPYNIACRWSPLGAATACPKFTLYERSVFERHSHEATDSQGRSSRVNKDTAQTLVPVGGPTADVIHQAVAQSKLNKTSNLVCFTIKHSSVQIDFLFQFPLQIT